MTPTADTVQLGAAQLLCRLLERATVAGLPEMDWEVLPIGLCGGSPRDAPDPVARHRQWAECLNARRQPPRHDAGLVVLAADACVEQVPVRLVTVFSARKRGVRR